MSLKMFTLVALLVAVANGPVAESAGLVQMISDYARVAKNTGKPTTETVSTSTTELPTENSTIEYEDFDELQEEDRSLKQGPDVMKYFNGLVSLLALMYKFNGKFTGWTPQQFHFGQSESRGKKLDRKDSAQSGKRFQEAQDRFEFPQKKFKYHGGAQTNMIDQQYQPVENYPPYNPLGANTAETYNQEDKKTSYDSDLMTYDSSKGTDNVEIQQSYSYEVPYESAKPTKQNQDDWTQQIHPVYQPWLTKGGGKDDQTDSYQPWMSNDGGKDDQMNSYQPWTTKITNDVKPYQSWKDTNPGKVPAEGSGPTDSESRQPWNRPAKLPEDFPIYHHDFKDIPHTSDHDFEFHEMDHPVDEDRVSKKPYSYYFLGRKLWYIPLLFSVYFIIYIGALVLKSVARHKIQFPEKVWDLHDEHFGHGKHRRHRKVDEITENYEKAVNKLHNKFM